MRINIYRTTFSVRCPNNNQSVTYHLTVESPDMISVEDIVSVTKQIQLGYHEEVADKLAAAFGGAQRLVAHHHGVEIETHR